MLHACRHDEHLPLFKMNLTSAHLDRQRAFKHQEEFIFIRMGVPHEFPFKFRQLDVLTIELANNFRGPSLLKEAQFLI